ncbi:MULTISPECIES: recombinase family protein [Chryseobacterium]|uniref:DNA invertase Pin-like site-specific DNA recombinase n=2 Tax=Chryseobacterium TaxID=59732 RepID=A0A543EN69_9FLAO|nr:MULTISPECIES: recombinase family protein [Chryseobacterium]MDR6457719.1 DNA invertase Pin-like site-specific DNA recombinase [Chryseobacterium vietnamense]TQM23014.1 DNA invertase Pin-like site-specific DNA recombinase [Chryseobacterium aquifrigidense]
MKIGYARVSTKDQNLDLQIEALEKVGCEKIYQEKISGATKNRPELDKMIEQFREGDELYVWRLDRLGRSLKNIIDLVLSLSDKGIIIKGLVDGVDTSTINGRLFLNLMASLAEYERELIRERTNAGLQAARARGRLGGRPKGYTKETISKLIIMRSVYKDPTKAPEEIYKPLGLTRATFYRYAKILDNHTNEEIKKMAIKKQ